MVGTLSLSAMKALFPMALAILLTGHALVARATWQSPEHQSEVPYILEKTKEHVLLSRSGDRASAALYAIPRAYSATVQQLTQRIRASFGIERTVVSHEFSLIGLFDDMASGMTNASAKRLWKSSWESSIARMQAAGFRVTGLAHTQFYSRPYNTYPARGASSVLYLTILDASEILAVQGSVVILYRMDRAKEWWWASPHDPFSFGYRMRIGRYVTRNEHALIDEWATTGHFTYNYFPLGANPVTDYLDEWRAIRSWLENVQAKSPRRAQ